MSTRAAVDCDRCKKRDCADYATVPVELPIPVTGDVVQDIINIMEIGAPGGRYRTLHFCGPCIQHTLHELRAQLPYGEQLKWNGDRLFQLVHQLTPQSRKLWAERFLKPLPDEAAEPSQGLTRNE